MDKDVGLVGSVFPLGINSLLSCYGLAAFSGKLLVLLNVLELGVLLHGLLVQKCANDVMTSCLLSSMCF